MTSKPSYSYAFVSNYFAGGRTSFSSATLTSGQPSSRWAGSTSQRVNGCSGCAGSGRTARLRIGHGSRSTRHPGSVPQPGSQYGAVKGPFGKEYVISRQRVTKAVAHRLDGHPGVDQLGAYAARSLATGLACPQTQAARSEPKCPLCAVLSVEDLG
jgi:hypothetical protein